MDLKKYEVLNELRLLALKADQPEVAPGATVTITPLVSDLNNSGALSFTASACIDLGVSYGAEPSCENNATKVSLATGSAVTTLNASNSFTGAADSFAVVVPASGIIFANRSAQDQFNGVSYLVTYKLLSADGRSVASFRRILVSTRTTMNQNPSIADVLVNSAAFSFPFASVVNLTPSLALGAESYQEIRSDGVTKNSTELLLTSWFVTDGTLKTYRSSGSDAVEYTAPAVAPASRKAILIAVTRDGRGGLDFSIKTSP